MKSIGGFTDLEPIGKGGMGVVYKAKNPGSMLTPVIAIKVMFGDFSDEERQRFLREARVANELRHENIVSVLDLKEATLDDEHGKRQVPYIVMEYLSGIDLKSRLADRDFESIEDKLGLMIGVASGLAFAHDKGIVHRDMKPSNIQVTESGLPKILDFGIARVSDSDLTMTGMQPGTPNYMSPEQVQGKKDIDHRSDIFSVGSVFYELLTYKQAFPGPLGDAVYKVMTRDPDPIKQVAAMVPDDICELVHEMLEKDRPRRPHTMDEVTERLHAARRAIPAHVDELRTRAIEMMRQVAELREEHRALLATCEADDSESTQVLAPGISLDPENAVTMGVGDTGPNYMEVWHAAEQARIELGRVRDLIDELHWIDQLDTRELLAGPTQQLEAATERASRFLYRFPAHEPVIDLQRAIETEQARREQERRRTASVRKLLGVARGHIASDHLKDALAPLDEIVELDPDNAEAQALHQEVRAALDEQRP